MLQEQVRTCGAIGKPCFMSIGPMLHVEFKKRTYCPFDFRGQGP